MRATSFLLVVVALAACDSSARMAGSGDAAPPPAPPAVTPPAASVQGDSLFFQLERTPCFGTCPTYVVRVWRGGSALYEGRRFVEREGVYEGFLTGEQMNALRRKAEATGFHELQDRYDSDVTDLPSTVIRLHDGVREKKVVGRVGTPLAFKELAAFADSLMNTVDWTPRSGED